MPSCQLIIIDTLGRVLAPSPFNAFHSNRATKNPLNQINTLDQRHGSELSAGWGDSGLGLDSIDNWIALLRLFRPKGSAQRHYWQIRNVAILICNQHKIQSLENVIVVFGWKRGRRLGGVALTIQSKPLQISSCWALICWSSPSPPSHQTWTRHLRLEGRQHLFAVLFHFDLCPDLPCLKHHIHIQKLRLQICVGFFQNTVSQ